MKYILLALLVLQTGISISQTVRVDETDKFDSVRNVITTTEYLTSPAAKMPLKAKAWLAVKGEKELLSYELSFKTDFPRTYDERCVAEFLLAKGGVVKIPWFGERERFASGSIVRFYIHVTDEKLIQLIRSPISDIRLNSTTTREDFVLDSEANLMLLRMWMEIVKKVK